MDSCLRRNDGGGEDEGCQRSLCGPCRGVESRGVGNHLRVSAGIRFYAKEGGAGNHPRVNAGIRFYAEKRRSGNSSAIKRGHPRSWGKLAWGVSRG